MFYGRNDELEALNKLLHKDTASLVCILGRRRIGKSTLIEEFGKKFESFIEIQGLGPNEGASNRDQLDHFATKISLHFNQRKEHFEDWTEAFTTLARKTEKGKHLIFLDEISWMGRADPLFSARLKDIWDTLFKKNPKLILVLCGSVSSWIEQNILKNANFEGRVSLQINLQELKLRDIDNFWKNKKMRLGSLEKMLALSVTGGVPKYVEELIGSESIQQNILRLCFKPTGLLFNEYEVIFTEIFGRKTRTFEKIIKICLEKKISPSGLAKELKKTPDSDLTEDIHYLELSGFLSRDFYYLPTGKRSKFSHLRVKDNYLRFYLKHILPLRQRIQSGVVELSSLYELKNFDGTLGLQFENVVLANRPELHRILGIEASQVISSSPFAQRKTTKTKGACQIDLLIHTQLDVFYLCELKCKRRIDRSVIREVANKERVLSLPKRSALKTVLVYEGEITPAHQEELEQYFYRLVPFSEFFVY